MHRWKSRGGKSQRREDQRRERVRRKKIAGAREGRKVAIHSVFPMICGSGGSKSRLAKAAGAEPCGQMRDEKLHAGVARNTFPSQNAQAHHFGPLLEVDTVEKVHVGVARSTFPSQNAQSTPFRTIFGSWHGRKSARSCGAKHIWRSNCAKHTMLGPFLEVDMVEKVHAVVARSTFGSQTVQNTPCWDHFWKLTCRKSARRCGAEHISKSKRAKHTMLGALLEVEMLKKCMLLWREAHFQVKMHKTHHVRTTFEGSDVILRGTRKGFCTLPKVSQNVRVLWHFQKTTAGVGHFLTASAGSRTEDRTHAAKHTAWSQWLCFDSFTMSDGMPDIFFQLCCRVCTVPCLSSLTSPNGLLEDVSSGCLLAIFRTCFLTVRSHGRCSLRPQTQEKKCWVLCTKGMALEGCLTFVSFGSYTTTEIRVCSRCLFFCANVNCLLSNCLDGKMKNHIDGWVKRLGT